MPALGSDTANTYHCNIYIENALIAHVVQTTSMAINTWHHQAVKDLGRGLRINCRARDGVTEGLESAEGKPILGVQFHPEEAAATFPRFQSFFDWLVQEATLYHKDGRCRREIGSSLAVPWQLIRMSTWKRLAFPR